MCVWGGGGRISPWGCRNARGPAPRPRPARAHPPRAARARTAHPAPPARPPARRQVVAIPTNRPPARTDMPLRVYFNPSVSAVCACVCACACVCWGGVCCLGKGWGKALRVYFNPSVRARVCLLGGGVCGRRRVRGACVLVGGGGWKGARPRACAPAPRRGAGARVWGLEGGAGGVGGPSTPKPVADHPRFNTPPPHRTSTWRWRAR